LGRWAPREEAAAVVNPPLVPSDLTNGEFTTLAVVNPPLIAGDETNGDLTTVAVANTQFIADRGMN
jgi:hypothetical protein